MTNDLIAKAEEKRRRLQEMFEELSVIKIHGVVGANGPGAGRTPPETMWTMNLKLIAWRKDGGPVHKESIMVTKRVDDEGLQELQGKITSTSMITFTGKICPESPFGDTRALLVEYVGNCTDQALSEVLSEYKKPVEMHDELLGKLTLNRSVDWFEGKVVWNGSQIDLSLSLDTSGKPDAAIETAKTLLKNMSAWSKQVDEYAVRDLLALKNDVWLEGGEQEVSQDEFISRMSIMSITTYPDGEFEFWHDDGDLFWGHVILVSGSLSEGLTNVEISG